ncbi:MAG TPA: DEAD/DEAH box helicase [Acidimicrobiales bacterium]|nr:DEAD/DEAH box helicase [Acidimicrobiales bacterium]
MTGASDTRSRAEFEAALGFPLDPFQARALDALDRGSSVLVAAPTGSGKTVVAEYAVHLALAGGAKAFYTTPLKALSNQKYTDFVARYGQARVGLLTGDNVVNPAAPVVVMTTEVLRNMIYAGSAALDRLRYVILDEVHYLQNPYRGAVWEEVIIHAPPEIDLVCLSATVSNAEQFADWVATVRGTTEVVIEERRPVELRNLFLVGDRSAPRPLLMPTFVGGQANPEALALDQRAAAGRGRRLYAPRRWEVVDVLADADLLPAIYFVFSRAGCDDAVTQCLRSGIRLNSPQEAAEARARAEVALQGLSEPDRAALGADAFLRGVESGVAAHHAGMAPPFKEAVEACFTAAVIKVVFATETLSLGINMPARSVVIERLTKFTGEHHETVTPGEYTQLTGRAGRRGLDDLGHAVVLWSPYIPFAQIAALASTRSQPLVSSFRPTYNMAANLVARHDRAEAHRLLDLSFAQYRADADVVTGEARLRRFRRQLAEAEALASCERGDVGEYRRLSRTEPAREVAKPELRAALALLKPGDVALLPGVDPGPMVVLSTGRRRGGDVKVAGVTAEGRRVTGSSRELVGSPRRFGRVQLPAPVDPSSAKTARAAAAALRRLELPESAADGPGRGRGRRAQHPVADCPDAAVHVRAWDRAERLRAEVGRQERALTARSGSLGRQFDRVVEVLAERGFVEGWALTDAGRRLARLYHESDILVASCLEAALFDGLAPPEVAAMAALFTFEARGPASYQGAAVPPALRRRAEQVADLAAEVRAMEESYGLPATRPPDPGFAALAAAWCAGAPLHRLLADHEISGGDFVRNIKTLIDLLRQLAEVAPDPGTAHASRRAVGALLRGVVAASSAPPSTGSVDGA